MNVRISNLKWLERVLFFVGLALVGVAVTAFVSGRIYSRLAVTKFYAGVTPHSVVEANKVQSAKPVDYSLWSQNRIKAYEATLAEPLDEPLALLKVDKIHLEVPIYEGTGDSVLNRGVGRIDGTARIGESGNVGIAGHRDGFFRGLKDVKGGDSIELETPTGTMKYVIDSVKVVGRDDVSVLENESGHALTLVTCFPFYFVGSAPKRYIVHASLQGETKTLNEPAKASLQATASRTKENTQ